jgi:hypothetical protein
MEIYTIKQPSKLNYSIGCVNHQPFIHWASKVNLNARLLLYDWSKTATRIVQAATKAPGLAFV